MNAKVNLEKYEGLVLKFILSFSAYFYTFV